MSSHPKIKHGRVTFGCYLAIVVATSKEKSRRAVHLTTSSRQPSMRATMTCYYGSMTRAVNPNTGPLPLHQIRLRRSPNCQCGPRRRQPGTNTLTPTTHHDLLAHWWIKIPAADHSGWTEHHLAYHVRDKGKGVVISPPSPPPQP